MKIKVREINLLPKEYIQAQNLKKYKTLIAGVLIVECFFFIVTMVITPVLQKKYEQKVFNQLEMMKADSKFDEVNETLNALEEAKVESQFWTDKYKSLKKETFVNTNLLDSLTGRLPIGITINTLNINSEMKNIEFNGEAKSKEQFLNYIILLQDTYRGMNVEFELSEGEVLTYGITLTAPEIAQDETVVTENKGGET